LALPTTDKILSYILLSMLIPYVDAIFVDHYCGFRRNRWNTVKLFCIRHLL